MESDEAAVGEVIDKVTRLRNVVMGVELEVLGQVADMGTQVGSHALGIGAHKS